MDRYKLIGKDGTPYESATPGTLGGHKATRIYGRLDCPSALRALANGGYVMHRVFFADEATAIAGRNLLARNPMVCTIGNPAADDSVLTFHPPPADPGLEVPGSRCSARYAPAGLGRTKTPDNASFVVEVGPRQFLFYQREVDRDRAYALLQGYNQVCWLGGGAEDIFGTFFNWSGAVTYF